MDFSVSSVGADRNSSRHTGLISCSDVVVVVVVVVENGSFFLVSSSFLTQISESMLSLV